jgi:hypothetical protein
MERVKSLFINGSESYCYAYNNDNVFFDSIYRYIGARM